MSPAFIALLHRFDEWHHALFLPAILVAVLLWFTAAFIFLTGNRHWKPFRSLPSAIRLVIGGFAAIVLFFMATGFGIEWLILASIRPALRSNIASVTVDGHPIATPQTLIDDLRKLPNGLDHHSHPTKVFRVILKTGQGPLMLLLERDSGVPTEYWVYDADYRVSYLGKIQTGALDGL